MSAMPSPEEGLVIDKLGFWSLEKLDECAQIFRCKKIGDEIMKLSFLS